MHGQQTSDPTNLLVPLWSLQRRVMRALPEFDAFLRDFGFVAISRGWLLYQATDATRRFRVMR
ncbi:MAG TPA: hypothetical protein VHF02_08075 [Luteimonas sp.]|nr:hypothetical protein [Luteimonas sp.]